MPTGPYALLAIREMHRIFLYSWVNIENASMRIDKSVFN